MQEEVIWDCNCERALIQNANSNVPAAWNIPAGISTGMVDVTTPCEVSQHLLAPQSMAILAISNPVTSVQSERHSLQTSLSMWIAASHQSN